MKSKFGTEHSEAWRKLHGTICLEKISLKMVGTRSLLSLKNSAAKIYRFLMCIGTDLSIFKRVSNNDVLSLHSMCRHLLCKLVYYLLYGCETSILKDNSWTVTQRTCSLICTFFKIHVRQYSRESFAKFLETLLNSKENTYDRVSFLQP